LLERGSVFHGALPAFTVESGAEPVAIEAYGAGPLPVISAYKSIPAGLWTEHLPGIWKCTINDGVTGNTATVGGNGANIGFLKVDGTIKPIKRSSLLGLLNEWDFYSDMVDTLYVKLASSPGIVATEILAAPRVDSFNAPSHTRIRDIEIIGAGAHGANLVEKTDIDMQWCHIHEIGGSYLTGTTRYGNGVQLWINCTDVTCSNLLIGDVYDTATTMQGQPLDDAADGWTDCHFDNNIAYRCTQAFEVWADWTGGTPPDGSGFRAVTSLGWTVIDGGQGELGQSRPDTVVTAALLLYPMNAPENDIRVSISEMSNCAGYLIYSAYPVPSGYALEDSTLTMMSSQLLMNGKTQNATQFDSWVSEVAFVTGSTMTIDDAPVLTPREDVVARWASGR
jgi:hypothetical protein